jgi:hypothetical protein
MFAPGFDKEQITIDRMSHEMSSWKRKTNVVVDSLRLIYSVRRKYMSPRSASNLHRLHKYAVPIFIQVLADSNADLRILSAR